MTETPKQILLTTVNNLGDCIAFLPVAAAVRRNFPKAEITMLSRRAGAEAAALTGTVGHFMEVRASLLKMAPQLRLKRFDIGFMASGDSSRVSALMFLGGVPKRIGFDDCRLRFLLTVRVRAPQKELEAERNFRLVGAAGLSGPLERPPCRISETLVAEAREKLRRIGIQPSDPRRRVLIHPGSSSPQRRWPAKRHAEICNRLLGHGLAQLILLEGPAEPGLCAEVQRLSGRPLPILSGIGRIGLLGAVMNECHLFVGHSTGPLHLAFLVGLPSVSLWGDTDPAIWGPAWDKEKHVLLRNPVPCSGCEHWDKRHIVVREKIKETCEHCMDGIMPDAVFTAIEKQLELREGEPPQ